MLVQPFYQQYYQLEISPLFVHGASENSDEEEDPDGKPGEAKLYYDEEKKFDVAFGFWIHLSIRSTAKSFHCGHNAEDQCRNS